MSNPIRRTIRTVGSPAVATATTNDVSATVDAVDESQLRDELESYLEELDQSIEPKITPAGTNLDEIEHEIRVEIPSIESPLHCRSVISDLEAAFTQTPAHSRWIVDLRGLQELPLLLIGALERYQQELAESSGVVRLELSSKNTYPDPILTRLASSFELQYIDSSEEMTLDEGRDLVDIDAIVQRVLEEEGE